MKKISCIAPRDELDLTPLDRFVGMNCTQIHSELGMTIKLVGKSYTRSILEKMLESSGIEMDPGEYQYKLIRVDEYGKAKNPASFKVTDYYGIIDEEWKTSEFRKLIQPVYVFFVMTHGSPDESVFKGYVVHSFIGDELKEAERVWTDTRDKIRVGDYDNFLTDKDTSTFFFKIHAVHSTDRVEAPFSDQPPRSFWMSRTLVNRILSEL